jgi:hypothetical protein
MGFTYRKAKAQDKIYHEQPNFSKSQDVRMGRFLCLFLNSETILTITSKHNFPPIHGE